MFILKDCICCVCLCCREPLINDSLLVENWEQVGGASEEIPSGEERTGQLSDGKQQDTPTEPETTNDSSGEDELGEGGLKIFISCLLESL